MNTPKMDIFIKRKMDLFLVNQDYPADLKTIER